MVEEHVILADLSNCTGCTACAMICPGDAIVMQEDSEGFARPSIDLVKCIHCGACNRVCPVLQNHSPSPIPKAYATQALDFELRRTSSSGGIFYLLGEHVIRRGGVVFGCILTKEPHLGVRHVCAETCEELSLMKGSKYVQSDL